MLNKKNHFKHIINKPVIFFVLIFITIYISVNHTYGALSEKKYIFIDGGAYLGEGYILFQTTELYSKHSWKIFAIEANPYLIDHLPKVPNLTILNKAMWIKDGTVEFYIETVKNVNSSLFKENAIKPYPITVESIDFGKWLERNFTTNDYIIVSLDIEGAEYEILEKMLDDGTIQYIDRLYVEFHPWLPEKSEERGTKLLTKISNLGITVEDDCVEGLINREEWIDYPKGVDELE